jgi:hypothetical protein
MDMSKNNLVRFKNITKKNGEMFANFKVKGVRGGTIVSASISVMIDAANVDATDSLEKIIDECARIGVEEFKKCEFEFEGLVAV